MTEFVPFPLTPAALLRVVRELAADTARIDFAQAQEKAQGVVNLQHALRVLRDGRVSLGPYVDLHGNTCCELERVVAGRLVRVVIVIEGSTPDARVLHVLHAEEV